MDKEVARYCSGEHSTHLKDNIRIVKISDFDGSEFEYWDLIMELSPNFLEKLWNCGPINCSTGQTYPPAPKPSICIVDGALAPLALKLISQERSKIWFWSPASSYAKLLMVAPSEFGGFGNLEQDAKDLAEKTGKSIHEATAEASWGGGSLDRSVKAINGVSLFCFHGCIEV
ncbi:hypothetical protein Clacol_008348 [Clathrus columnatus]|uniref:Uncharacterized protein n=1 Tax=Clathrus columnatus TaxID=1419009 RepID=A0AAV5ANW0_9AGAM|nr:hypothetical protein Clacol_008348 [Clathrus columnatus]